jgi:PAS domain S-box-containing protein
VLYTNQAFSELTGFSSLEIMGQTPPFSFWAQDKQFLYTQSLQERQTSRMEWSMLKKNRENILVESSISLIPEDNNLSTLVIVLRDITEQKRTEAALKENEAYKDSLLTQAPDPIVVYGADNRIEYVNPAFEKLTGFSSAEVLGISPPFPWWPTQSSVKYISEIQSVRNQPLEILERVFQKKNGELFWVSLKIRHTDEKNKKNQHVANWIDITERKKTEAALQESQAFNASLLNDAPDPILVLNMDTSIRFINPAFERITGLSAAELIGKRAPYPWWRSEETRRFTEEHQPDVTLDISHQEMPFHNKLGETLWISLSAKSVKDENGQVKYRISNWIDISERKKSEEALKESEAFKTSLLDDAPNPIFVTDQELRIIYINPAMEKLTGFINAELMDKKPPYPWWPEEKIEEYSREGQKLRTGPLSSIERMSRKKNGETFWVSLSIRNIKRDGEIVYSINNWVDITPRKKMEEELKESEAFSSSLLSDAPNPVVVFNPDGTIKYVNPALEKLTGFENSELIGIRIPHPWWPREKIDEYTHESIIGTNKIVTLKERYFCKKNGDPLWVIISMRHIIENTRVKYTLSNWVDITELKKMQEKISELYDLEKKQREELQEEAMSRGLFLNVLAHELRAPLTPIMTSTSILRDLLEPRKEDILNRLAANICDSTEKLSIRLEELLDLARYDRGTFRLNLQEVDLHSFLEGVLTRFEPGLIKRRQPLTASVPADLPSTGIDPSRMEQVIINLLSNASKYSSEGAEIIFKASLENRQLLVEVQDHGIGISPETQKQLFQPYHRVEQDRKQFPGLGLGLAVSKQIIDAHGGKIWVNSQVGQGSSFFFSIPLK